MSSTCMHMSGALIADEEDLLAAAAPFPFTRRVNTRSDRPVAMSLPLLDRLVE